MIGAGIDFAFAARADDVARAILIVAQNEPPRCIRFSQVFYECIQEMLIE